MQRLLILLIIFTQSITSAQSIKKFPTLKKDISLTTGINMKYVEEGPKNKETLLLLHGYTDTGRSFFQTMDELVKLNSSLRIIAPDLRGHGETSMPFGEGCKENPESCFTPANFAADIIDLMDQLHINTAFIAGHSMGSVIAQEIAIQYPERVKGIVLIGTFVNGTESSLIHDFIKPEILDGLWRAKLESPASAWPSSFYETKPADLDTALTSWIKTDWVTEPTADDDLLQAIYSETIQTPLGTWIGAIDALGRMDNRTRIGDLHAPVLILWAIQDTACPHDEQEKLKVALNEAVARNKISYCFKIYGKEGQTIDFGHNLQWGAPKEVAADIAFFIKTGKPKNSLSYAHPNEPKKVITEKSNGNIVLQGK